MLDVSILIILPVCELYWAHGHSVAQSAITMARYPSNTLQ